ncbi:hypothetical protein QR685DRAFT_255463 [Neurospora intermedia]|uniref:Cellulase n=1 Tax=Neurospora intermedia TaxID=5142 RepID=A0ABR3DCV2_NEUIN
MPPKTSSAVPKLRGREPCIKDLNLIYSVLENITGNDTNNKGLLKFDAARAAQTANFSSGEVLRNKWYKFRWTFLLNSNFPVDLKRARCSSIEPELRSLRPTASDLNLIFSILENLKDKVLADWAKVAERAGLGSADEAQQAWVNLCAEYQLWNEDIAVWRASNSLCPRNPLVVVADKLQPAFISVADAISVTHTHQNPTPPFTPIRPTVLSVPSRNNLLLAPASALTLAPVKAPTITGPHAPVHHQVFIFGTQINKNNNKESVNNKPVTGVNRGTQTDAKCCPTKAIGFKVVARALLWRSILAEKSERKQHEKGPSRSAGCHTRARASHSWSWDTPIDKNESVINGEPTITVTSTNGGIKSRGRDAGTQTGDPCCRATEFGFRVAFVYMFVVLNAPDQQDSVSDWPLEHWGTGAEPVSNSRSYSSMSNSVFFNNLRITTATTISPFPGPTTGLTGTAFYPTTKGAKTLLAAARYIWSLSVKAEYEHDESLGEWPGWLLLDQGGGGGVSSTAYENALASAVAPLRLLWLRVAVMM